MLSGYEIILHCDRNTSHAGLRRGVFLDSVALWEEGVGGRVVFRERGHMEQHEEQKKSNTSERNQLPLGIPCKAPFLWGLGALLGSHHLPLLPNQDQVLWPFLATASEMMS
ncbi:misshapen-like kinase 1 [Platysternon megacephalum]|uniref:Misshapen-like kinase 1 n=1 Tax=Platysternon megacephalum TaxID=55544 RepID=A0A4D9DTR0_9SAUR|nr:misshapen-like kinase 1 [Platysternon megacephalum]